MTAKQKAMWFDAVYNKNIETMQRMLEEGFDVNVKDSSARAALHWTCYNGNIETAKFLIDNGADVNIQDVDLWLWAPLHAACYHEQIKLAKFLIENGADVTIKDKFGKTPFDELKRKNPKHYEELMVWITEEYPEMILELMASENTQSKSVGL